MGVHTNTAHTHAPDAHTHRTRGPHTQAFAVSHTSVRSYDFGNLKMNRCVIKPYIHPANTTGDVLLPSRNTSFKDTDTNNLLKLFR